MENASKALMMVTGALIAVLLLSLFAYIFTKISKSGENLGSEMDATEVSKYNEQFLIYNGREDMKIQEVVSLINLAKDSNRRNEFDNIVHVTCFGSDNYEENDTQTLRDLLNDAVNSDKVYKCKVDINKKNQLVNKITITQQP